MFFLCQSIAVSGNCRTFALSKRNRHRFLVKVKIDSCFVLVISMMKIVLVLVG